MKKIIALAVCVVQFLFSSCIADTTTMKRISSKPLHTHFSIIDNQVYVTLEKGGWFSDRYSIYAITPYDKPHLITSYRGFYSFPAVYRGKWLINKFDVAAPFSRFVHSSVWHTLGFDGSILPYDTLAEETSNVYCSVTDSMLYKTVDEDPVYYVMYWDEESHEWYETGIQASGYFPDFFSSLVFSASYNGSDCQVFDVADGDYFSVPKFYEGVLDRAILYEDKLIYVDSSSIGLYEMTTGKRSIVYAYDQFSPMDGSGDIFLQGESVFFTEPNTKQIIRYDLATNEMVQTKAKINNGSEFVIVGDWVYSIEEDEFNCAHLLMSNLITGEECSNVVRAK